MHPLARARPSAETLIRPLPARLVQAGSLVYRFAY